MRIECCATMSDFENDPLGIESFPSLKAIGYDRIERSLFHPGSV